MRVAASNSSERRSSFIIYGGNIGMRLTVKPVPALSESGNRRIGVKLSVHRADIDTIDMLYTLGSNAHNFTRDVDFDFTRSDYASTIIDSIIPAIFDGEPPLGFLEDAFRSSRREFLLFLQETIRPAFFSSNYVMVALFFIVVFFDDPETVDVRRREDVPTSVLDKLTRGKYQDVRGKFEEGYCSICLEKFKEDDEASRMPCFHVFHADCLLQWLKRNYLCPLCRCVVADD